MSEPVLFKKITFKNRKNRTRKASDSEEGLCIYINFNKKIKIL